MSLFRNEAIEAKRLRLWGEVRLAQPPSLTIWTVVLTLLCAVLATTLLFGRYTRKETVPGFLIPEAGVVQVRTVQSGRIARVLVRDGQAVAEGAPLIEFTSDIASIGQGPMLDVQLAETGHQEASLESRRAAVAQGYADDRRRLADQVAAHRRSRAILESQRRVQVEALALSEADAERLSQLQAQGYAPRAQVDARRRTVLAERLAVADIDSRLSELDRAAADLQGQMAAIPAREAEDLAAIARDRSSLAQRRAELEVARGHVLRAPVAGTISAVQARVGMLPSGEVPLLSIAPEGSPLEARLLVPTRAAGFLEVGQVARLQVEAFPFQRFGFVEGRIVEIARTVTRPGEAAFLIEQTAPVYEVRVSLDRDYVTAYGERRALQPGMGLRADIPIDRRRLWQQLFDPLLAAAKRTG